MPADRSAPHRRRATGHPTASSATRAQRAFAYGAALGYLADLAAADPRRGHPVAAFGRAAAALEQRLWRDHRGRGAAYTALCAGGAVAAAALAARAVRNSRAASTGLTAAATWAVLGGTSLGREARMVGNALETGDIEAARERLPHLCGRDPQSLDERQIARAVVESVAENTSDAVVGALVWGALGGVPGLVGFRAVNTLDAMVGHKSPRHRRFGWASARLDDVAGWPGARLTALLAVLAGPDPRGAWRVWHQDGARHPSPNAGPVEASFAGALGVRLGGTLAYAGRVEQRPVLGAGNRPVEVRDIERAVRLSRRVSALALVAAVGGRLAWAAVRAPNGAGRGGIFSPDPPLPETGDRPRPRILKRRTGRISAGRAGFRSRGSA
jgi:adenosylcobinamide-phosphate synthase